MICDCCCIGQGIICGQTETGPWAFLLWHGALFNGQFGVGW